MNPKLRQIINYLTEGDFESNFQKFVIISVVGHMLFFLIAGVEFGSRDADKTLPVYRVKMIGGAPGGKSGSAKKSSKKSGASNKPKPAAQSKPKPKPEAKPTPAPPKPAVKSETPAKASPSPAAEVKKAVPAPIAAEKPKSPAPEPKADQPAGDDSAGADEIAAAIASVRDDVTSDSVGSGGGSGGGTGSGDGATAEQIYQARIWGRIKRAWRLPDGFAGAGVDLTSIIIIRISSDGRVISKFLDDPSGNKIFDEAAMKTIDRASPFGPFPAGFGKKELEIGLRFKSSEM